MIYLFAYWIFVCIPGATIASTIGKTKNKLKAVLSGFTGDGKYDLFDYALKHPSLDILEVNSFCNYAEKQLGYEGSNR